jgi:hypothetical protein
VRPSSGAASATIAGMRILIITALLVIAAPTTARADIGIGLFVGEPLGFDLKIDIERRQSLDLLFGVVSVRNGLRDASYAHLTYLLTPFVGHGRSVVVPLRLGIGVAMFGFIEEQVNVAARTPLELAFMFRSVPLEIYGEIALKLTFVRDGDGDADLDVDGGIGLRFYF